MSDPSRLDPEMRGFLAAQEEAAAAYPPIRLEIPLDPHRLVNDALALRIAEGGPPVAETTDRWIAARGRRIFCRLYRPRTDRALPVLVYFHGGGWVWASVDTHDRLAREYAATADIAVLNVDYALAPEAKFPQALEECAAVVRHLAAHGAEWGLDPTRILLGGDFAGGNLALATALLLRDTAGPALRGVLATYPVCDSDLDTPTYRGIRRRLGPLAGEDGVLLERLRPPCGGSAAPARRPAARRPRRTAAGARASRRMRRIARGGRGAGRAPARSRRGGRDRDLPRCRPRLHPRDRARRQGPRRRCQGRRVAEAARSAR